MLSYLVNLRTNFLHNPLDPYFKIISNRILNLFNYIIRGE